MPIQFIEIENDEPSGIQSDSDLSVSSWNDTYIMDSSPVINVDDKTDIKREFARKPAHT